MRKLGFQWIVLLGILFLAITSLTIMGKEIEDLHLSSPFDPDFFKTPKDTSCLRQPRVMKLTIDDFDLCYSKPRHMLELCGARLQPTVNGRRLHVQGNNRICLTIRGEEPRVSLTQLRQVNRLQLVIRDHIEDMDYNLDITTDANNKVHLRKCIEEPQLHPEVSGLGVQAKIRLSPDYD